MPSPPRSKSGSSIHKAPRSPSSRSHRHSSLVAKLESVSPRVVLGHDALASLPTELNKLCLSCPLVIYSPSRLSLANRIRALLPNLDACFISLDTHPGPAILAGRDAVISVGGPRAVALARRIGFKMSIPHICVPTMHSGAAGHLPPPWGHLGEDGGDSRICEEGGDGEKSLPTVILYDQRLTESRIRRFSAPSGVCDDTETEVETDLVLVGPDVATGANASVLRSAQSSTAQWSYINLPGV
ncbi:uncharacterized protein Triagg1_5869 [Trichoderma aggressivum f. europaeum]|uniref:Alcohol dehydrogenase iron-type/glycerol dehydrogenase GldA domain-containing protein n=1 Tax=Trichoderma aggressivum f. europaeum TaxID=173218 RepID=A0AAE1J4Y6_9HYPO|nr:hypothetical protein Triagg1_5869 [Trichoderma aggressivum f. europaeum]